MKRPPEAVPITPADHERFMRLGLDEQARAIGFKDWRTQTEAGDEPEDAAQEMLLKAWETFVAHRHLGDEALQRLVSKVCADHRIDRKRRAYNRRRGAERLEELREIRRRNGQYDRRR